MDIPSIFKGESHVADITMAVRDLHSYKAADVDEICPGMLKVLFQKVNSFCLNL